MKTCDLLLSSLSITEDNYNYKGLFILKYQSKSLKIDMANLSKTDRLREIKEYFELDEEPLQIRELLMDMIMEKVYISSRITEGEKYEEKAGRPYMERAAGAGDMA